VTSGRLCVDSPRADMRCHVETGRGTYRVTGLVRFALAPGTIAGTPVVDHIGDSAAASFGPRVVEERVKQHF